MREWLIKSAAELNLIDKESHKDDLKFLPVLKKMIQNPECEAVWCAMEKRAPDAAILTSISNWSGEPVVFASVYERKMMEKIPEQFPKSSDQNDSEYLLPPSMTKVFTRAYNDGKPHEADDFGDASTTSPQRMVWSLTMTVAELLEPTKFANKATKKERKEKSQNLIKLINKLRSEIKPLFEFETESSEILRTHLEHGVHSILEKSLIEMERHSWIRRDESTPSYFWSGHIVAMHAVELFDSLESGILEWSKMQPELPHPNDVNAPRLKFIRGLSRYFSKEYGTPLNRCVLEITRTFFKGSEDLTEATISAFKD